MIYAGKEISQRFFDTFPQHVEISGRTTILNTDFQPLSYRGTLFRKISPFGADFRFFQKNTGMGGGGTSPPPPVFWACGFLGCDTIGKPAEALCPKVSFVLPPRSNWNGVAANFLHDRSPGHGRVIKKFFAKSNRHFKVHIVGI